MYKHYRSAVLILAMIASASAFAAPRPIDESRPLDADGRVSVSNVAGFIHVEAWDREEVRLTGRLGDNVEALEIEGSASQLSIEVRYPRSLRNADETELELKVPRGAALELEAVSADIEVRGISGRLQAQSVSGEVSAQVDSEEVELSSVSGDVSLRGPARRSKLESVSGDVTVTGAADDFQAETVSGDIELVGGPFREVDAQSVSGDVDLDIELSPGAEVDVETLSGEVRLSLPSGTDASVAMHSFSGSLVSELGTVLDDDAKDVRFNLGKGGGGIELESFSGDIELRARQ
ncbi:MAG: DUF4097 family beta strand repeat-containing protein [Pseudomonadota bacterium]|nr:DUF4097 family beta strand repeat-containing protein [Pseudomonadota bacterium]